MPNSQTRDSRRKARRSSDRWGGNPASRRRRGGRGWRVLRALRALPLTLRVVVGALGLFAVWAAVNGGYQVLRKPTELLFLVSGVLTKSPPETWRTYGPLFTQHATAVIPPELLAALAQVESSGDPVARPAWRWQLTAHPLEWYRPASSAVGMYQITDGTFQEAQRYCIHNHVVVEDGPWHKVHTCWFNRFYTRVVPTHAVELTAAWLDREVARALADQRRAVPAPQQQDLAAVIHLCGASAGAAYAARGFRLAAGQQCGTHDVHTYLARVNALKRQFAHMAGAR